MFLIQSNIAQSFHSPIVRVLLGAIVIALAYVFYKEVRKIPAKLFTLMITAFIDMVGLLMIIPLLLFLFMSRLVQGAGGGTVGVIQAYVADSTEPKDRTRALGWLSATTNLGVVIGPVIGSFAVTLGTSKALTSPSGIAIGHAAPGIFAAALCLINIIFAARYLTESRGSEHATSDESSK